MSIKSVLLDCLRYPNKLAKQREDHDSNPSRTRKTLTDKGALRDNFPNFMEMGFRSQAFVDVEMLTDADPKQVKLDLHNIPGIIMIYTVFGQIDMRCKVVGIDLHAVEEVAMKIRGVPGIGRVNTSVIVDETIDESIRNNWAELIDRDFDRLPLS